MYGRSWRERQQVSLSKRAIIGISLILFCLFLMWMLFGDVLFNVVVRHAQFTRQCIPRNVVVNQNPSIAIIMSYETDYYAKLGKLSETDKREYAAKHGYTVHVNNDILDSSRKPSWFKVLMAQQYLASVDWLFYVDADTVIMEHDVPLTT